MKLEVLERLKHMPDGKYVDVTAITPTPLGEGKTTTTVGLSQALGAHLGKSVMNLHPPTFAGIHFWHQRRRCRRWIFAGDAHGRIQLAPDRGYSCHNSCQQPLAAAIDARMFHEVEANDEAIA